jgi:hypothetical protein
MEIHYLSDSSKAQFRQTVMPVWQKYEPVFGRLFMESFLTELEGY